MRVTGDCFRAPDPPRLVGRLDVDPFVPPERAAPVEAPRFAVLLRVVAPRAVLPAFFALLLPRAVVRFDADDFRRVLPPDDFDAVAMMISSRKVALVACARFARNADAENTEMCRGGACRRLARLRRLTNAPPTLSQNHRLVADCNHRSGVMMVTRRYDPAPVRRVEAWW